ncbi:universal stress protein [Sphaerisporangium sp. B11E5]|uniref:universal stress protein n=1 Tax=Sphaerisporangium sp. B11E5 TaxID=3153563 RepID=UPI00325D4FF4
MILAGVDGSDAGLAAARWAGRAAVARETPLRLVHAMPAWACDAEDTGPYAGVARWMRAGAHSVLNQAVAAVQEVAPCADVSSGWVPGDPRDALIAAAAGAELLVVGNHGVGGFRGLLLGSVALGVAGRAPCPVVLVRTSAAPPRPEIVLGVDGGDTCAAAVEFAFAEAQRNGAALTVVHATVTEAGPDRPPRTATRVVAESRVRHPEVKVAEQDIAGHPVDVLLDASEGAEALVIGSRGRGGVTGLVLGSVSHALIHHATCTIVVVPTPPQDGR